VVKPAFVVGGARVFAGDCREVLKHLPDNSVDSVVTDPPYELGFMGKSWDSSGIAYDHAVWLECLRVLKPGGHILAFGGSRTWHRLAVAVEDAGFELRDSIAWIYGSGFPKSLDVSKAIDKAAGVKREVVGERTGVVKGTGGRYNWHTDENSTGTTIVKDTIPATSEAKTWEGWGTALKPAFEPVVVGRKPFGKGVTVAENVLAWGVGGLNIDGSRIGALGGGTHCDKRDESGKCLGHENAGRSTSGATVHGTNGQAQGRWPANVILDEVTAGLLDEQSGVSVSKRAQRGEGKDETGIYGSWDTPEDTTRGHNDTGGASRFFYVAKASKRDRNEGLEELEGASAGAKGNGLARVCETCGASILKPCDCPERSFVNPAVKNFHPTVKPTALMRYLIKLVTRPGGTVLDPFTGSGSTGKAALLDGFQFVGVELTEEYLPIIEGRLRWANEQEETDGKLF
jgi:site-specific DNA-methyltransferase (adenine-specific)